MHQGLGADTLEDFSITTTSENGSVIGHPFMQYCRTRDTDVRNPSDMLAIGDAPIWFWIALRAEGDLQVGCGYGLSYWQCVAGIPRGDRSAQAMWRRHNGRWQVGFCDGHAENLRGEDLFNLGKPAVQRRWNMDNQAHRTGWTPGSKP